jgi:hypothetical protein
MEGNLLVRDHYYLYLLSKRRDSCTTTMHLVYAAALGNT